MDDALVRGVLVADHGVDAALVSAPGDGGGPALLVLRPHQTFGSAVNAVQSVLPTAHMDDVRALVREHLPDAIRLDDWLPLAPAPEPPIEPVGPYLPMAAAAGILSVFLALVASLCLMQYGAVSEVHQIISEYEHRLVTVGP